MALTRETWPYTRSVTYRCPDLKIWPEHYLVIFKSTIKSGEYGFYSTFSSGYTKSSAVYLGNIDEVNKFIRSFGHEETLVESDFVYKEE